MSSVPAGLDMAIRLILDQMTADAAKTSGELMEWFIHKKVSQEDASVVMAITMACLADRKPELKGLFNGAYRSALKQFEQDGNVQL